MTEPNALPPAAGEVTALKKELDDVRAQLAEAKKDGVTRAELKQLTDRVDQLVSQLQSARKEVLDKTGGLLDLFP